MERLTEKIVCNLPDEVLEKLGIADISKEDYEIKGTNGELCRETCEKYECDSCPIRKAIEKLADYEDAEEQGLLKILSVAIGSDVYFIPSKVNYDLNVLSKHEEKNRVYHQKVAKIIFKESCWFIECDKNLEYGIDYLFIDKSYQETWFTSQAEAEQALAEMKEV